MGKVSERKKQTKTPGSTAQQVDQKRTANFQKFALEM